MNESKEDFVNVIVDLSHWNDNIDFAIAKEDGIIGVIHKATEGLGYIDGTYSERRKIAQEQGLLWGAYHFCIGDDGTRQADHFLDTVGDISGTLLALDIEQNTRGSDITQNNVEDFILRFHERTNRLPLIYGSKSFLENFSTPTIVKCPLWIAKWGELSLPSGWKNWVLWQYTNGQSGEGPYSVKGIGICDRDKFNGTLEELKSFWLSGEIKL